MNPDQPSREQIEARITALLLGELPAAEAELLHWTISQDPELQKLHGELNVTIGFVREAMKNPTGAPLERNTPLKLPQNRRQNLLAHFKTARPQPPKEPELSWLRRIKVSPLIVTLAVIAIIAVLAAISIPNFVTARSTSKVNACINNLRQIDAAKQEWALEKHMPADAMPTVDDLTPYLQGQTLRPVAGENYTLGKVSEPTVAEMNGKRLTANPENFAFADTLSLRRDHAVANAMSQVNLAFGDRKLETGQASRSPNSEGPISQKPKVPAPQVQIALPKTESSQADSDRALPYSQNVVGYVNVSTPPGASTTAANQLDSSASKPTTEAPSVPAVDVTLGTSSAGYSSKPRQEEPKSEPPAFAFGGGKSAPSQSQPGSAPTVEASSSASASPPPPSAAPILAGGNYALSQSATAPAVPTPMANGIMANQPAPEGLSDSIRDKDTTFGNNQSALTTRESQNATPVSEGLATLGTLPASTAENPPASLSLMPPRMRQQYGQRNGMINEEVQAQAQPQPQPAVPNAQPILEASSAPPASAMPLFFQPDAQTAPAPTFKTWNHEIPAASATAVANSASAAQTASSTLATETASAAAQDNFGLQAAAPTPNSGLIQGPIAVPRSDLNGSSSVEANRETMQEAPGVDSKKKDAATLARDGQMLYEMGKVDEAQLKLQQSLELDPDNRGASYYLQLAKHSPYATADRPKIVDNDDRVVQVEHAWEKPVNVATNFAGSVPVVTGVPVTGELFPSSVLRTPQSQQQYAQNERKLSELPEKERSMEAPKSVNEADVRLTPPSTNAPIPQPEIQTTDNAFSTFSMNVSDVSFKLAMASMQKGQMPDPASIRSEEFINAFDYHDPEPLQGEPLAFTSERAHDPFAQERDLLRFSVKAGAAGRQGGRALNLVLLLDTSGSMERADRVAIIREALRVLSSQLQPQDVVSVVTFARTARLWADGVPGDQAGATLDKVGSITPEGGTNLEEAMRLAYETALRHFIAGGMNRVVMLTDGAANLGDVDPQALTQTVESERRQGIALDCFGIGWDDYNDDLLEQLSSNGDGRYAFINSADEAATEFAAKLAGALQVAAEDVKVQVEFNPNRVTAWRQIGYAKHQLTKEQFRDNSVAAGAIASREAGNALYVIETNPNGDGPIATVRVRYRVPGTQNNYERSWNVDYTGAATELAQSSPAMRLAASAAEISEWMASSPFAQDVTPDDLLNYLSGVPQFYGTDERPKQLEWLIREAKSVSGK